MVDPQTIETSITYFKEGFSILVWYGLPSYLVYKTIRAGEKWFNSRILDKKLSNPEYKIYIDQRKTMAEGILASVSPEGSNRRISPIELRKTLDSVFGE